MKKNVMKKQKKVKQSLAQCKKLFNFGVGFLCF